MAWTTPRTWVTGETVTAALMNAHIRDNLNETGAATVTTAGDIVYADAANSLGSRVAIGGNGERLGTDGTDPIWRTHGWDQGPGTYATNGTSGSTAYFGLDNTFWDQGSTTENVEIDIEAGSYAMIFIGINLGTVNNATDLCKISFAVSGDTTIAATDGRGAQSHSAVAGKAFCLSHVHIENNTLTPGSSNVFTFVAAPDSSAVITLFFPSIGVVAF